MDVLLVKLGLIAGGVIGIVYLVATGLAQIMQHLAPLMHALGGELP
jgi:hypothetical protein